MIREKEILQAIDRLRPNRSNKLQIAYLLTNIVLDVELSEMMKMTDLYKENRYEQLFNQYNGVLPLSPKFLVERHPDIFSKQNTVTNSNKKFIKTITSLHQLKPYRKDKNTVSMRSTFFPLGDKICSLIIYKVKGNRSRKSKAIVDSSLKKKTVLNKLEKLHGKGSEIEIVEYTE